MPGNCEPCPGKTKALFITYIDLRFKILDLRF